LENQIILSFGNNKTKGPKQDSKNQLSTPNDLCLMQENLSFINNYKNSHIFYTYRKKFSCFHCCS